MAELNWSFWRLTTSLPRSTHWPTVSLASCPRVFIYSRPSCAVLLSASRVSRPDRGAYRTPTSAPNPNPARNHIKPLLSLSDMHKPSKQKSYHIRRIGTSVYRVISGQSHEYRG